MEGVRTPSRRNYSASIITCAYISLLLSHALLTFVSAAPPSSESVAVLSGYQLYSVTLRSPASRTKTIDLRTTIDKSLFSRPGERQGDYPSVKLLSASNDGGAMLINLCCLEHRDDGPLVALDAQTGKQLSSIEISDANTVAAFLPQVRGHFIAHWTDYITQTGGSRTSVFDSASGKPLLNLPPNEPPSGTFLFLNPSTLLVRAPSSREYRLLDTSSWKDAGALKLPITQEFSVLDAREGTVLLDSRERLRNISTWSYPASKVAIAIDAEPSAGISPSSYFLAGRGDRVVKWRSGSGKVAIYGADGRLISQMKIGSNILQYAVHPEGNPVIFAVDADLVVVDVATGQLLSRLSKTLPIKYDDDLFLFWQLGQTAGMK
jgi:hypothetical protein